MSMTRYRTWMAMVLLVSSVVTTARAEPAISLSSPLDRQVVQRDQKDQAVIRIAGKVGGSPELIEAMAEAHPGARRGKPLAWTTIAKRGEIDQGAFSGQITLGAGGWYTILVRGREGDRITAEAKIERVGVGEVFITAGQSNSANFGTPRQSAKDGKVVYFDGKQFVAAKDPIPGGCGGGGSPWPILGDLIAGSQGVPVCFRSASLTWTEVKNWMPGVKAGKHLLYDNLVSCAREFPQGGVRAVLWHQGESDSLAKTSAQTYRDRLATIIRSLEKDSGYRLPWFVAQASFHPGSKEPEEKAVAAGQQLLWKEGIAKQGAVTDDLGQKYRSDRVHFNQLGLTTHAQRWFEALSAEYGWKPGDD